MLRRNRAWTREASSRRLSSFGLGRGPPSGVDLLGTDVEYHLVAQHGADRLIGDIDAPARAAEQEVLEAHLRDLSQWLSACADDFHPTSHLHSPKCHDGGPPFGLLRPPYAASHCDPSTSLSVSANQLASPGPCVSQGNQFRHPTRSPGLTAGRSAGGRSPRTGRWSPL